MKSFSDGSVSEHPVRGRRVAAVILLVVAGLTLAEPYLPVDWHRDSPLLLGIGFILWAALGRCRGLLVPGGILVGVGVGTLLQANYGEAACLFAMGGGFLLIAVLSWLLFGPQRRWLWPLFPAGALAFSGLVRLREPDVRSFFETLQPFWPLGLIAIAAYLLLVKPRATKSAGPENRPPGE